MLDGVVIIAIGPVVNFMTQLNDTHLAWLEDRRIEVETAIKYGVFTGARSDFGQDVLVFPYSMRANDLSAGAKFRGAGKKFWQSEGGLDRFWNDAVLNDDAVVSGDQPLIITEGEMDALAAISAGHFSTVSVPTGAPPVASEGAPIVPDPEQDKRFAYIWRSWKYLEPIKRVILAVDADAPGQALLTALKNRLGVARCAFVQYPDGCKDLNDVLIKHGPQGVTKVIHGARPVPLRTLSTLHDWPEMPDLKPQSTSVACIDPHYRPYPGGFTVVTGVPGHGKSTLMLWLLSMQAKATGMRAGIVSLEMPVKPYLRDFLRRFYFARPAPYFDGRGKETRRKEADDWINRQFVFLGLPPTEDGEFDLEDLIETAEVAVVRYGISKLLIDPWNEVEHLRRRDESETDYIGRAIRQLKRFGRNTGCEVIVVAHPVKMGSARERLVKPSLYDISGSAHWANKADHGIVVWRADVADTLTEFDVKKSRFRDCGVPGSVWFRFDPAISQFTEQSGVYDGSWPGDEANVRSGAWKETH